jgi:tetratricopeptide (TPR) repeat protein
MKLCAPSKLFLKSFSSIFSLCVFGFSATSAIANPVILDRGYSDEFAANLTGNYAIRIGDSKMAARAFERAWQRNSDNLGALRNSIKANLISGDLDNALRIAKSANANIRGADADIIIANEDFKNGKYKTILAFKDFDKVSEARSLYARHLNAWALAISGKNEEARAAISYRTSLKVLDKSAYYSRAMLLDYIGEKGEAALTYQNAYNSGARTSVGVVEYANFLDASGKKDEALQILRATEVNNESPLLVNAYQNLKNGKTQTSGRKLALIAMANIAQSISAEQKAGSPLGEMMMAISLDNSQDVLKLDVARYLISLRMDNEAVNILKSIPQSSLFADQAQLLQGGLLYQNDKIAGIAAIEKVAKAYPNFVTNFNLATYYSSQQEFSKANNIYNDLITKSKLATEQEMGIKKWQLFYGRANSYLGLENSDKAIADLRAALDLYPRSAILLNSLGYALADAGKNLDEARQFLETAVRLSPQNGQTIDSLGWLLFKKGDFEAAIDKLENAMRLAPNIGEIADHLGDAYFTTGRKNEAMLEWQKAISLFTSPNDKARVQKKLDFGLDAPSGKAIIAQSN